MPFPALAALIPLIAKGAGAVGAAGAASGAASAGAGASGAASAAASAASSAAGAGASGGGMGSMANIGQLTGMMGGGGGEKGPNYGDANLGPWHNPELKPGSPNVDLTASQQHKANTAAAGADDPLAQAEAGLKLLERNNFNPTEHHNRMLNIGPFADAAKRQSIWNPVGSGPIEVETNAMQTAQLIMGGGKSNTSAMQQMQALEAEDKAMGIVPAAPAPAPAQPNQPYTMQPAVDSSARFKAMEEQDKARAEAERQAQKKKNRQLLGLE